MVEDPGTIAEQSESILSWWNSQYPEKLQVPPRQ